MNEDELKKLWQQQPLRDPALSPAQVISAMHNKMTCFRRVLLARDIVELLACAVVAIAFGYFYFFLHAREPISRLGDLIVIGSSFFIAFKVVYSHRTTPPASSGATMVESLRAELNSVRAQSRLLGSVLWWYILPGTIGSLVMIWGSLPIHSPGALGTVIVVDLIVTLLVLAVDAWVYWLNQRARSKQLLPLEAQLEALLHSAETGEPLDETHRANLRPIALSMAAAGQVKPVEFKLAFWQIAIYGVSGIVGIWFFLMLSLVIENPGWKSKQQVPGTFAPSVHTEETNRYSVVTRKVIDRFNAGDYSAVQQLYNPDMSRAFPEKETSDFYTRLAAGFGNIENFEGPVGNGYQGWTAFRLHCQRGDLTMSLALDEDDKIAGLYIKPAHRSFVDFKSCVLQLFSWHHLLWLPPFFLGGLLYSWLIQKWVGKAVGISTLGIHLSKGLNLVLWDEIKEVRPLRFLNVRNLWLIQESGEKALMHWTPLERHSDVKAAVECCAPPKHPIRKYLSLLTRI